MELEMRSKCLGFAILVFIILHTAAADDDIGLCKIMNCGKGTCNKTSSGQFLDLIPECECEPGWKQPSIGFSLPFLPCVIPNCTFKADCGGNAPSSAPSSAIPPSSNSSADLLNPCKLGIDVCGEGSCVVESDFGYKCNCNEGYENLFNLTAGPCFRPCKLPHFRLVFKFERSLVRIPFRIFLFLFAGTIGADCSHFGFSVGGNGSETPAPQPLTDTSNGFMADIPYLITMAVAFMIPCFLFLLG